jgi:adenosylmethionine-8-amino-7-oxononanoate aminotransferase
MVDGERGDLVLVGPPYVIGEDEVDELCTRFRAALDDTVKAIEGRA